MKKTVVIQYFAILREVTQKSEESVVTTSENLGELYEELKNRYQWKLSCKQCRVAVNDEFVSFDTVFNNNDRVVFIPPVAGG